MTFRSCAKTYIADQQAEVEVAQAWQAMVLTLEAYAHPPIGDLHPKDLTVARVLKLLQPIWASKTETATRVCSRIEC